MQDSESEILLEVDKRISYLEHVPTKTSHTNFKFYLFQSSIVVDGYARDIWIHGNVVIDDGSILQYFTKNYGVDHDGQTVRRS